MFDLDSTEKVLRQAGFETGIAGGVLSGRSDEGMTATEITVDGGGGCLLKKTRGKGALSKQINLLGQKVFVTTEAQNRTQLRVSLKKTEDIKVVIANLDKL